MGRRILSLGLKATHTRISMLPSLEDAVCASDYDAFVFDPQGLNSRQVTSGGFFRKQAEVADLVLRKGGLLLCLLRPPVTMQVIGGPGHTNVLSLLDTVDNQVPAMLKQNLKMGTSNKWGIVSGARGITLPFVRALMRNLLSEAFLQCDDAVLRALNGTMIAANSVGWPVSLEFVCGSGRLCFVPIPQDVPEGQLGAEIVHVVEEHFGGPVDIASPDWVNGVLVPGADASDARIAELERLLEETEAETARLVEKRSQLLGYRLLLFGYGKSVLEPIVRRALRELGFNVLEPDEYEGEWDVDLTDPEIGATAVGEVEGSEGSINVDKLRQLLEYVEAEENAGRQRKGILIGNGYRLKAPTAVERGEQFTEMAIKRARGFEYCLLPTIELFRAVCAVLRVPEDQALKKRLRESILSTVGVWKLSEDAGKKGGAAAAT